MLVVLDEPVAEWLEYTGECRLLLFLVGFSKFAVIGLFSSDVVDYIEVIVEIR